MTKILLPFLILLSSCAVAGSIESFMLNDRKINLNNAKCQVEFKGVQIDLAMKGDCYFIKRSNSVHAQYYKDINAHVMLIVGDPLPKDPNYPLTLKRSDCGATIKALVISDSEKGMYLSDKSFSNTITCAGVGADEKEYYILSH